jgi:beta-galactosidase/beta-glucuronidase
VNNPDATQVGEGTVRNLLQQVEEMVEQNYNHPSVAFWGMANEIGFALRYTPKVERASTEELLARMRNVAHTLEPSRPTIQADVVGQPPYSKEEDTVALNPYYGRYDPDLNDEKILADFTAYRAERPQHCTWKSVRLNSGDNRITVTGTFGSRRITDSVTWLGRGAH